MLALKFSKEIKAPAQKVWDTLWSPDSYLKWTKAFNPDDAGGSIQSDWQVGGKTLFLDSRGSGMVSTIKSINEPYDVVFEHLGDVTDGKEDTTSEKIKDWAGSLEEYHLSENNGVTTLKASVQTAAEWEEHMNSAFVEGLEEVKKLSEQEN